jgi:hypothetical protein
MSSPPQNNRRNTVSVAELRRVLANADAALAATAHHSPARAIPTAAQALAPVSPPSSAGSSPSHSPLDSPNPNPDMLPHGIRPFDVQAAAETCRRKTGYVSFMDVDGLGAPAGAAGDDDGDGERPYGRERSWSWSQRLFGLAPSAPISLPTASPAKPRTRDAPLPPSAYTAKRV